MARGRRPTTRSNLRIGFPLARFAARPLATVARVACPLVRSKGVDSSLVPVRAQACGTKKPRTKPGLLKRSEIPPRSVLRDHRSGPVEAIDHRGAYRFHPMLEGDGAAD